MSQPKPIGSNPGSLSVPMYRARKEVESGLPVLQPVPANVCRLDVRARLCFRENEVSNMSDILR